MKPRRTIRLRLTLVYGALFLASGAGLLVITYLLVSHELPQPASTRTQAGSVGTGSGGALYVVSGGTSGCQLTPPSSPPTPGKVEAQVSKCLAEQQSAELNRLLIESGVALAIMTVASVGLGWLVAGRVLRPLRAITGAARSISASSLHSRLALTGPDDELKELGDTFDGLLARLEAAFTAQRQFAANASHELRTPLARQRTLIEVALADPQPSVPALQAACGRVLAAGEQQERLIEALLTLARSQRGLDRLEPVDLAAITADVVCAHQVQAAGRQVTVEALVGPAMTAGDPRLAERLVTNLVDNAIRYNQPGGWVRIHTGTVDGLATLRIANSGPVIPPGEVARLFGPFQRQSTNRTGGANNGTGLGLSIVNAITAAHQARLWAQPRPEGGLDIDIRFAEAHAL
ncbi:MAG TPA: ATP-binding protein [Streptosporangiaceae bacterium]|jgi:signal transduction histidine kinase